MLKLPAVARRVTLPALPPGSGGAAWPPAAEPSAVNVPTVRFSPADSTIGPPVPPAPLFVEPACVTAVPTSIDPLALVTLIDPPAPGDPPLLALPPVASSDPNDAPVGAVTAIVPPGPAPYSPDEGAPPPT